MHMQIKPRAYPHPVLAPFSDDIVKSVFQPVVTVKPTKSAYVFEAVFKTNNADLLQLVAKSDARYAVHVECTHTRYRNIFKSDQQRFSFEVSASLLEGRVEVTSFILAANQIDKYKNDNFHADYARLTFRVRKGDTLAVGHDREFTAEKKKDPLRNVPSIFSIVPSDADDAPAMDIETGGAKVRIILSKPNHDAYASLKGDQSLHPLLSTAVIVPALVAVLDEIKRAAVEGSLDSYRDRRWYIVVARRLHEMGFDPESTEPYQDSTLRIAHQMVGQPLTQSLEGLRAMLQETE
jgi:hypothetical protein